METHAFGFRLRANAPEAALSVDGENGDNGQEGARSACGRHRAIFAISGDRVNSR